MHRNESMFMAAGTAYVYSVYGLHHCLNVSSREPGAAVLLRALEPVAGLHLMAGHRAASAAKGRLRFVGDFYRLPPTVYSLPFMARLTRIPFVFISSSETLH